jgi:hypothetical protein
MAERRRHPVAAVIVVLVTLTVVSLGELVWILGLNTGGMASGEPVSAGEKAALWPVLAVVLAAGLWCAWRVGSRRWGLRRRRTTTAFASPPAPPSGPVAFASPFRFFASRSAAVLAPDTFGPVGRLEQDGEYTAVAASGAWVLVEDKAGRRGWVPDTVVPARVRRRHKEAGEGGG